jgi:hypothetical protein
MTSLVLIKHLNPFLFDLVVVLRAFFPKVQMKRRTQVSPDRYDICVLRLD